MRVAYEFSLGNADTLAICRPDCMLLKMRDLGATSARSSCRAKHSVSGWRRAGLRKCATCTRRNCDVKVLGGASLPDLRKAVQMLGSAALKSAAPPKIRSVPSLVQRRPRLHPGTGAHVGLLGRRATLGFPQPSGLK